METELSAALWKKLRLLPLSNGNAARNKIVILNPPKSFQVHMKCIPPGYQVNPKGNINIQFYLHFVETKASVSEAIPALQTMTEGIHH